MTVLRMKAVQVLVVFVVIAGAFSMMPYAPAAEPRFSNIPGQPVEPGTTVTLTSDYVFDTGTVTARVTQNGVARFSTFSMDSNHVANCMAAACRDQCNESYMYAEYRDADEVAQLSMTVIYNVTVAGSLATEGISLKLLVYEVYGNDVSVLLTGKKGGADASLNCSFPVSKLAASKFGIGALMQPQNGGYRQNDSIPIYALGYNSTVEIVIKNAAGKAVTELTAESKGMLAYTTWKVPVDQSPGSYTINVKPAGSNSDGLGASGVFSLDLGIEKALDVNGGGTRPPGKASGAMVSMPGWAPIATVAAVLIVGVPIGVLLIRKKKD
jgi:hypothetical protein